MSTIYTVGYGVGWNPEQLADELDRLGAVLWDIRFQPWSKKPGWSQPALRSLLGPSYVHVKPLGNLNYASGGPVVLVNPAAVVAPAQAVLARGPLVLLCGCRDVARCHRSEAARYLAEALGGVTVIHLEPPTAGDAQWALSLQQPMAWAIFHAAVRKDVENRDTQIIPPASLPRRIRIHASAKTPKDVFEHDAEKIRAVTGMLPPRDLRYGAILGSVEVVRCATMHCSPWFVGPYGYVLDHPIALSRPVPCRGALGLWAVPAEVALEMRTQVERPEPVAVSVPWSHLPEEELPPHL